MDVEQHFIRTAALICEPSRAKMLWDMLDGRAYTAGELALSADISATAASNHLSKLLEGDVVKVEIQGRHRYYSFANPETAYVVESLAMLGNINHAANKNAVLPNTGDTPLQIAAKKAVHSEYLINHKSSPRNTDPVKFCRSCYDHLAGYVGVCITDALELNGYIKKTGTVYDILPGGWQWFSKMDINESAFKNIRRAVTRQCLDWSERRPHLAGQLGALMMQRMLEKKWLRKVNFSRELIVTPEGKANLKRLLLIDI